MKPLLLVALSLILSISALPENIEDVKELPQAKETVLEAEESEPQVRSERCTDCSITFDAKGEPLAALKALPGTVVHTQEIFEECSSASGCAGIKVKDGKIIQRFGDLNAFNAAAAADLNNEFSFHAASFGQESGNAPFWWMNKDSPFKAGGQNGESFEKFSKTSSFSSSSSGGSGLSGAGVGNAGFGAGLANSGSTLNLGANPFLNGGISNFDIASASQGVAGVNPSYQSSSFEQSSFSSSSNGADISKNPFLNAGAGFGQAQGGFAAQNGASSQNFGSQFSSSGSNLGSVSSLGSVPSLVPLPSLGSGSNVNLIQTQQKEIDFDYAQTQQNIGSTFQSGSSSFGANGAGLQQTCAGEGYACVLKSQCNNGVVNSNGAGLLQASTKKQYCNLRTEICCRIEVGIGAVNQGSGLFGSASGTVNSFGSQSQGSGFSASGAAIIPQTQTNFIETDTFSSGSEVAGVYRPGAVAGLKPGIPYLPPDISNSGSTIVTSTLAPRPIIVSTPKPFVSTAAPGYLPPIGAQSINRETIVPKPTYVDGSLILDETRQPRPRLPVPVAPVDIPSGCAAALKCTPIEFCTADGYISNSTVRLSNDQIAYRTPLTDCKAPSGILGKCCRDPYYTDPWPANQIGTWVPGVFGGNDGKYVADSRGSGSNTQSTARPFSTGEVILPNYRTTTRAPVLQVGQYGQGSFVKGGVGQYGVAGQGQIVSQGQGQLVTQGQGEIIKQGQGLLVTQGQGQYEVQGQGQAVSQGFGQGVLTGQGTIIKQGGGQAVSQGFGQGVLTAQGTIIKQGEGLGVSQGFGQGVLTGQGLGVSQGFGQGLIQGQGQGVAQGFGQGVIQGQGSYVKQGEGQIVTQGQGLGVSQGFGQGVSQGGGAYLSQGGGSIIRQGQGQLVTQGFGTGIRQSQGYAVENEYSESVQRVFLQPYTVGAQCGLFNGQQPFGNRNSLEVDFAEIPWQAMILLKTNKSLLCGGVITRPDVVLTSASCVDGLDAQNVLIKGGEWKLAIDEEPLPFQIVQVKTILRHPFYKTGTFINDAAILILSENLRFAKNIYPICMPTAQENLEAFYNGAGECIVTGWGKEVLQSHLLGSVMHSLNVSLLNPGECQNKISTEYPHLLEYYDKDSCVCGQPTNPLNNICAVDIGSALACTTGDGRYVLKGLYSWDSGCQQIGNQIGSFFKFDVEWYEWALGLIESIRFGQGAAFTGAKGQIKVQGQGFGIKQGQGFGIKQGQGQGLLTGQGVLANQYSGKFTTAGEGQSLNFGAQIKPIANTFTYSEKVIQTEPKIYTYTTKPEIISYTTKPEIISYTTKPQIISYTTKPEIVTFTTKPEYFTYTTKPKIVTYTTKPQIVTYTTKPKIVTYQTKPQYITYETSGSGTDPQYVPPGISFKPSFTDLAKPHTHSAACKCEGKK